MNDKTFEIALRFKQGSWACMLNKDKPKFVNYKKCKSFIKNNKFIIILPAFSITC